MKARAAKNSSYQRTRLPISVNSGKDRQSDFDPVATKLVSPAEDPAAYQFSVGTERPPVALCGSLRRRRDRKRGVSVPLREIMRRVAWVRLRTMASTAFVPLHAYVPHRRAPASFGRYKRCIIMSLSGDRPMNHGGLTTINRMHLKLNRWLTWSISTPFNFATNCRSRHCVTVWYNRHVSRRRLHGQTTTNRTIQE